MFLRSQETKQPETAKLRLLGFNSDQISIIKLCGKRVLDVMNQNTTKIRAALDNGVRYTHFLSLAYMSRSNPNTDAMENFFALHNNLLTREAIKDATRQAEAVEVQDEDRTKLIPATKRQRI